MTSINFVALLGEIKDEVRHNTTTNSQVANFTLVTRKKAHPNAKIDWISTYHNVTAWGRMAETVQHCKEGDAVQVDGAIETESWDDKKTGTKKYKTVIKANNLTLMDEEQAAPPSRANEIQEELDAPF
jgi:single-strand DNA-binding protein